MQKSMTINFDFLQNSQHNLSKIQIWPCHAPIYSLSISISHSMSLSVSLCLSLYFIAFATITSTLTIIYEALHDMILTQLVTSHHTPSTGNSFWPQGNTSNPHNVHVLALKPFSLLNFAYWRTKLTRAPLTTNI